MKHVFAVETEEQLTRYSAFAGQIRPRLEAYIEFLQSRMEVRELPRMIVWTSMEIATEGICDIPVPAYTNEYRVVMTPETETWRKLYLRQLDSLQRDDDSAGIYRKVYTHYQTKLGENHVMQILGHELAHHSEWFLEDFASDRSDGIWFEEGMAEYISRRYFLTEQEFAEEAEINQLLVDALRERYGRHSLENFGQATYEGDYAGIFYEYWRSFLAIKRITERHGGDLKSVFTSYHQWNAEGGRQTLLEWFGENDA